MIKQKRQWQSVVITSEYYYWQMVLEMSHFKTTAAKSPQGYQGNGRKQWSTLVSLGKKGPRLETLKTFCSWQAAGPRKNVEGTTDQCNSIVIFANIAIIYKVCFIQYQKVHCHSDANQPYSIAECRKFSGTNLLQRRKGQ